MLNDNLDLRVATATGEDDGNEQDFLELRISEYLVFLFALDTYFRYLEEIGVGADDLSGKGLAMLRILDRLHLENLRSFLGTNLTNRGSIKMLEVALRKPPTSRGAAERALRLRTILSRGGTATVRHVFGTSIKSRRKVLDAIEASMVDESDVAMAKFAAIMLRNKRLEKWISVASNRVEPVVPMAVNPIQEASKVIATQSGQLLLTQIAKDSAPSSENAVEGTIRQDVKIQSVEQDATDTARKSLQKSGQEDTVITRSEAIGIAAAVAAAAAGDPENQQNLPPSLKGLDPEQRAAVLTDGKVLVAAGAGSGKTHSLTARLAYLVQDKNVSPNRIMAIAFNTKAATEIRERVASRVGDDVMKQMNIGTMHAMFRKFVCDYGTPEQKSALTTWLMVPGRGSAPTGQMRRAPSPAAFNGYMARVWKECMGSDPPRRASMVIQAWIMNDISPQEAKLQARPDMKDVAEWYEWQQGFKGAIRGWQPPCSSNPKAMKIWGEFLSRWRDNGRARLGDFSDMIVMTRDLLRDNPGVRKRIQGMFDHILVDESQDLNYVQHAIVAMLTEHIGDGSDGKSVWMVGDEIQAIYRFQGARPELFGQFHNKDGWVTKSIATNYRCLPEILEFANNLMSQHPKHIPVTSRPDPNKPLGQASIVLAEPGSHAEGALETVESIKQDIDAGSDVSDYAVLTRTNMEINDFETACIVNGVPYTRKGSTSFLKSPETVAVMSYMDLVCGTDFEKMQKSLAEILNKPNRFFLRAGEAETIVSDMIDDRARRLGVSRKNVNPMDLFDEDGVRDFVRAFDPRGYKQNWQINAAVELYRELGRSIQGMRTMVERGTVTNIATGKDEVYTTDNLITDILNIPGLSERGKPPTRLIDQLMPQGSADEEADDPELQEEENKKPLGNVAFLYKIAQADEEARIPRRFKAKLDSLNEAAKDLRMDADEWNRSQAALPPSERKAIPAVTLSTVHSMKGAQFPNVTVVMAKGVFPFEPRPVPGEDALPIEDQERLAKERELEFLTERQLAYVALTRAGKSLTVLAPKVNAYGKSSNGRSTFIHEAGLKVGQNVEGKNGPSSEDETLTYDRRVV